LEVFAIISYQRDRFVDTNELCLPFLDDISGTIRGYRIFTACRTFGGKIFRLEDHLNRLYSSAASIHMQPPVDREQLKELLRELVSRNLQLHRTSDLLIDVIFSGGLDGSSMVQSGRGAHLYMAVQELIPPPAECYQKGVALATFPHMRMYPDVKLLNYMGAIMAHQTVVPLHNAYDAVFTYPPDGRTILEGSTFTVFFVNSRGEVLTPPLDGKILDSVTRRVIFEIARQHKDLQILEVEVTLDDISEFSEAFMVSTTRNVLPVTRINDQIIGSGEPGPVTHKIVGLMNEYIAEFKAR
jgi:branched-subunit amino acid aminotransferase/4-amino-4-deoxychorismate lyase